MVAASTQAYERAVRMQAAATDACDADRGPQAMKDLDGPGVFARQCIMARRLAERGVRFIQLYHGAGQPWDSHDEIEKNHKRLAGECDQGIAALLTDLKQRDMLKDTLVICSGEFGRTPTVELSTPGPTNAGLKTGRDHHHPALPPWTARRAGKDRPPPDGAPRARYLQ